MSDVPIEGRASPTMGAATLDAAGQIDIRGELARIDRDRAETQKLFAESRKLLSEDRKLISEDMKLAGENAKMWAEAFKLEHEANKLRRDRSLSPWLAAGVILSAAGGVAAFIDLVLHLAGKLP